MIDFNEQEDHDQAVAHIKAKQEAHDDS